MDNIFQKWRKGLEKSRKAAFGHIVHLLGTSEISDDTWDEFEAVLIQADLGIGASLEILEQLKAQTREEGWLRTEELHTSLQQTLLSKLGNPGSINENPSGPTVTLIVGVNGSGKTTSIAKLAAALQKDGKSLLLAAGDTYRAAAIEQLQTWGKRLDLRVIASQSGGDPGAVAFDAVSSAVNQNIDHVLIDTAGRLHTRFNLMEELKKVERVCGKALPGAPHNVLLVMDATTGQNAVQQAQAFQQAVGATGIILAKLDSSARGGMVFSIQQDLDLPIVYVGLGETIEDLDPFNPELFLQGILPTEA